MRKWGVKALFCLAALVLALAAVRLAVEQTMPDYPQALGNTLDEEKITGTWLVRTAAEQEDTLTVFGSSELKTFEISTHPANFFAGKRCGFQVNLVGRGSCQSLVHAMAVGASGESLKGKKIVLITAPQSYVEGGIAPDLFLANFSEQQMLTLLQDDTIPAGTRQYLAARVQALIAQYNAQNGTNLQTHTAAGLLSKAWADGNGAEKALLAPYGWISKWLLDTKDLAVSARLIRAGAYGTGSEKPGEIDWAAEEQAALQQAREQSTNNEFYMLDSYYQTYVGHRLSQMEGRDAAVSYDASPEYEDLRCLFDICKAKNIRALFVHVPVNGKWSDYTELSQSTRQIYYKTVRAIATQYDNITMLDLTGEEYTPYFLCDTMHLGWKGWLAVDRAMVEFWNADEARDPV